MRDCRKFYKNVNFSKPLACLFHTLNSRQRIRKNRKFKQKGVIS
ncbi:hypothetical protein CSUNSWCD_1011 [Campylobacter showae CSUNSWCD]|uniref:Uncharacterized protein n=1 Tax=Campylobacter showae CSUNSWCD TaxID=1244083 RepID=M5INH1_9BACT|nr:hypothetical protein CSUNSWCD_1011 [Campylobacter showae CSUNSWCD]